MFLLCKVEERASARGGQVVGGGFLWTVRRAVGVRNERNCITSSSLVEVICSMRTASLALEWADGAGYVARKVW